MEGPSGKGLVGRAGHPKELHELVSTLSLNICSPTFQGTSRIGGQKCPAPPYPGLPTELWGRNTETPKWSIGRGIPQVSCGLCPQVLDSVAAMGYREGTCQGHTWTDVGQGHQEWDHTSLADLGVQAILWGQLCGSEPAWPGSAQPDHVGQGEDTTSGLASSLPVPRSGEGAAVSTQLQSGTGLQPERPKPGPGLATRGRMALPGLRFLICPNGPGVRLAIGFEGGRMEAGGGAGAPISTCSPSALQLPLQGPGPPPAHQEGFQLWCPPPGGVPSSACGWSCSPAPILGLQPGLWVEEPAGTGGSHLLALSCTEKETEGQGGKQ